jgi:hypothetical protein
MNPQAPVCVAFARGVFCDHFVTNHCKKRHVYECPEWVQWGRCSRLDKKKKCVLAHPKRFQKNNETTVANSNASGATSSSATSQPVNKQPHYWKRDHVLQAEREKTKEQDEKDGNFIPFDWDEEESDEEEEEDDADEDTEEEASEQP